MYNLDISEIKKSKLTETKNPDFIVIGAQKGGTTALFSLLAQHPDIYMPPQKEIEFFSNELLYQNGFDWYLSEFFQHVPQGSVLGEISPQYMFYKKVPPRIKKHIPTVKLIAILRNPIDRAYSHYRMSLRRGKAEVPFIDAIKKNANEKFILDDNLVEHSSYYQFSCYSQILSCYLKLFGTDQLLVLFQEDLQYNPLHVLQKLYSFLDVKNTLPGNPYQKMHQGGVKRFPRLENLILRNNPIRTFIKPLLSYKHRASLRFWIEQLNVKPVEDSGPTQEERLYLAEVFADEYAFIRNNFYQDPPWADWK